MHCLKVLPAATDRRWMNNSCAPLVLAAEIECNAFMSATKQLFGEEMTPQAGGLWVEALETDSGFQCEKSGLRLVTIVAASKLADLMGQRARCHTRMQRLRAISTAHSR